MYRVPLQRISQPKTGGLHKRLANHSERRGGAFQGGMLPIARMGGLRRKAPPGDLGTKSKNRTRPCPPPLWMSVGNSLCGLLGVSAIRVFLERRFVQSLSQSRIAFQAMPLFRVQI